MLSIKKSSVVLGGALLALVGGTARADTVDVKVPFAFEVQGQLLPAGHYQLVTDLETGVMSIVGDRGTKANAITLTMPAGGHDPAGEKPALQFKRDETAYRLSVVWESGTDGLTINAR